MQTEPNEKSFLTESSSLKNSPKMNPANLKSLNELFPVIHIGITSKNDLQLCMIPAFSGIYDKDRARLNSYLKSIPSDSAVKALVKKNQLKLNLSKNSVVIPTFGEWWKSSLTSVNGEPDGAIKLSRPLGEEGLVATNVIIIENKKGTSKSFIQMAQILKENNFHLSSSLEEFLKICGGLEKKINLAKENGQFFYFSEIEQNNLYHGLKSFYGEYREGFKKLGWRSSFKFFSELGERSQDLIFYDPSKKRPGSFQELTGNIGANKLEEVRKNYQKITDLTQKLFGTVSSYDAVTGAMILKVPDIDYDSFENFFTALVGPFIDCRIFNVDEVTLEKKTRRNHIDTYYQHGELSPYRKARDFLWKILLGQSEVLSTKSVSEYDRALFLKNGLKFKSAYIHYLEHFPTKPLHEGGFFVTSPTSNGLSRVDFAVPDPEYASLTQIQKEKMKLKGLVQPTLSLKNYLKTSKETASPSVIHDKYVWPQGRIFQLIHFSTSMVTLPRIGTSAEFLFEDEVGISSDLKAIMGEKEEVLAVPELSVKQAYNQLEGLYPANMVPDHLLAYPDTYQAHPPHSLSHIQDLGIKEQISINVRYSNTDGLAIEQCLEALKKDFSGNSPKIDLASNSPENLKENKGKSSAKRNDELRSDKAATHYDAILDKLKDLLQFEAIPYFMINGSEVSESDWFQAKKSPAGVYEVAPGQFIPEATYTSYTENYYLKKKTLAKMGRIPMQKVWSSHLNFISGNDETINPDAYLQSLKLSISKEFEKLDEILKSTSAKDWIRNHLPRLESSLREYQAQGIMWIKSRLAMNYGVCLADEMGLGKTLQAIGLLLLLKNPKVPSLVVVPKSLLMNWKNELERFAPELKVKVIEDESSFDDSEIYLMSYGAMRHKSPLITKREWNLAILDEAQSIKNSHSLTSQIAGELTSKYRLALTGTPVENHASELWSIINWLNPQYLGSVSSFEKFTRHARVPEKRPYYLAPLRECLKPIILRRLKNDPQVALGLPEKVSQDLRFELSETQCLLYKSVVDVVLNASPNMPQFTRMAQYLRSILFLKQICIHPSLFLDDVTVNEAMETSELNKQVKKNALKVLKKYEKPKTSTDLFKDSTKLAQLYEILEAERYSSNGILIFTQYLKAADLLMILLKDLGYDSVPFINGSLSANRRQEIVDQFNKMASNREPEQLCPVLICSLKAGGTGLNLTGADRVIHLDRWWNPAVENQATDRAHRFGQTRTVFVNTLTNDGTLEDSMNRIFEEKRRLSQDLLSDEDVALTECLRDESGYLNLVDPKQLFYKN